MSYEQFDIVDISIFPYIDQDKGKARPALIISTKEYLEAHQSIVALMITGDNRTSADDIEIIDYELAGLTKKSRIMFKIFSRESSLILGRRGTIDKATKLDVKETLKSYLNMESV